MTVPADRCAPVALFAFARLWHLQQTVASLQACPEAGRTDLTVFCDAARTADQRVAVDAVRAFADGIRGFASVSVVRRPHNLGLAASIVEGVTEMLGRTHEIIVVEDDLRVSPHFLRYMNDGLRRYAGEERVASIHGYCYPTGASLPETFFLRGADCWGWATWSRAWKAFEPDGSALLKSLREQGLTRSFDLDGSFSYTRMLADQIAGRNNSWAIRWHAACFLEGMLTLYPARTLVENIGNDASGTHSEATNDFSAMPTDEPVRVQPIAIEESAAARAAFGQFHRRRRSLLRRAVGALRRATG